MPWVGAALLGLAAALVVGFIFLILTERPWGRCFLAGGLALGAGIAVLAMTLPVLQWKIAGRMQIRMRVQTADAVKPVVTRRGEDLAHALSAGKLQFSGISRNDAGELMVRLVFENERAPFMDLMAKDFPDIVVARRNLAGPPVFFLNLRRELAGRITHDATTRAAVTIRNRLSESGIPQTTVGTVDPDEIVVELPRSEAPDLSRVEALITRAAVLEFKLVDDKADAAASLHAPPAGDEILYGIAQNGVARPYAVERPVLMTGEVVINVRLHPADGAQSSYLTVDLDPRGTSTFGDITAGNIGRRLAIILDRTVYSAPTIKEPIPGGHLQITGNFTLEQLHDLEVILRSGALPAQVNIVQTEAITASRTLLSPN
jgi:preprotein translocase subunit SecD